jgi:hypothetical protein
MFLSLEARIHCSKASKQCYHHYPLKEPIGIYRRRFSSKQRIQDSKTLSSEHVQGSRYPLKPSNLGPAAHKNFMNTSSTSYVE